MHALISNSDGLGVVSDMSKDVVTSVVNKRQSVMEQLVLEKKIEELKGQKSDMQEQGKIDKSQKNELTAQMQEHQSTLYMKKSISHFIRIIALYQSLDPEDFPDEADFEQRQN